MADTTPASESTRPTDPRHSIAVPRLQVLTPGQMLADNISTRLREMLAIGCYVLLARWGLLPGPWAAGLITLTVLPVEITRQLVKGSVARALGAGTIVGTITLMLAAFVSKTHFALTTAPVIVATIAALAN